MSSPKDEDRTSQPQAAYDQRRCQGDIFNGSISEGVNTTTKHTSGKNDVSGSHHRRVSNVSAGKNVHMSTSTLNLHISPLSILQVIQTILAFVFLLANRNPLSHPFPSNGEAGPTNAAATGPVHRKMDEGSIERDLDTQDPVGVENNDDNRLNNVSGKQHERPHDSDYDLLSLDDVDLRSIQAKSTTNTEIYTRLMLSCCDEGLPCWRPRPEDGTHGITPGDVGRFTLTNGFQKFFNIWDEEYAGSWQAPTKTTRRVSNHLAEGHTIVSGASSTIHQSVDSEYVELFKFRCIDPEGAVLACTTSADLEELEDSDSLQAFLIQHAGALYQQATLTKTLTENSLYIVTGCVKSASWGLAAFRNAPADQVLQLKKRFGENTSTDRGKVYGWVKRGTGEARLWPNTLTEASACEGKSHTLFLRGFKLAFSQKFCARMEGLKLKGTGPKSSRGDHGPGKSRGPGDNRPSGGNPSGSGGSQSPFPAAPMSSKNASTSCDIQVNSFPDLAKAMTLHPCDAITSHLLETTDADCALSHDDDWRYKLKNSSWDSTSPLDIIGSKKISVARGVAHLLPADTALPTALPGTPITDPDLPTAPPNDFTKTEKSQIPDHLESPSDTYPSKPFPDPSGPPHGVCTTKDVFEEWQGTRGVDASSSQEKIENWFPAASSMKNPKEELPLPRKKRPPPTFKPTGNVGDGTGGIGGTQQPTHPCIHVRDGVYQNAKARSREDEDTPDHSPPSYPNSAPPSYPESIFTTSNPPSSPSSSIQILNEVKDAEHVPGQASSARNYIRRDSLQADAPHGHVVDTP